MDIKNVSSSNSFKAVRISPAPENWNQQVLNSVLKSQFIRNIIKNDLKNERDTFLSFAEHVDPAYPDYKRYNHMFFNVVGDNKDITLGSHESILFESAKLFKKARLIKSGSKDRAKDLAFQISNLDTPEQKNIKEPIYKSTLNGLKKLAGELIVEKQRDYQSFREPSKFRH